MIHRIDNKIYKAALYCRLSKNDDDRNGDSSSIQTQKSLLERYCRENSRNFNRRGCYPLPVFTSISKATHALHDT